MWFRSSCCLRYHTADAV
ncbi:MAG: (2Fe-2S)-binding protein [SAR324 cluster bacterium]